MLPHLRPSDASRGPVVTAQPSETRVQSYILAQLSEEPGCAILQADGTLVGDPHPLALFWRQNTGAARAGDRLVRFGVVGQADITGVIRSRRVDIEVKTATGRQSIEQRAYALHIGYAGGLYILARDLDTVLVAVRALVRS